MRSIIVAFFLACVVLSTPAFSATAPDYSKRTAPLDPAVRTALVGRWTNPPDHLIIEITDVDLTSGKIAGNLSPTTGPASADAHELTGWVSAGAPRKDADAVVPVSFSTTLYEYGTLPV